MSALGLCMLLDAVEAFIFDHAVNENIKRTLIIKSRGK